MTSWPDHLRASLRRLFTVPVGLALFVVIAGWLAAEHQARSNYLQAQRSSITSQVAVLRADLEGTVFGTIQLVRGLIASIATEPDMDQARFEALARLLVDDERVLRNIGAAPDMVIQMMYPIEGNEQAIGLNYELHPEQAEAALRARDTRQLVLAGPVNLVQGGQGFIGRFPVFIPGPDGTTTFWGLVSTVMDVEVLYDQAGLDSSLPFTVSLTGRDATGTQGSAFYGPELTEADDPVFSSVQLPAGSWQIAAVPLGGWQTHPPHIWAIRALLLVAAGMLLIPSVQMSRLIESRQHAISELKTANDALHQKMQDLEAARNAQKQVEARLRHSLRQQEEITNRFQDVADISRSWVWEQDRDLRFTHVSTTFGTVTDLEPEALLGRTRAEVYSGRPETLQSADWQYLERRVARREAFSGFVFRMLAADGRDCWFQISGSPIYDAQGQFAGYRGAGMDVTAMQLARAKAEEANHAKTLFLANMSHEIRTPLNGVLGMAQSLRDVLQEPAHRQMVEMIRSSGEGLLQILNDILDISKIEAGKIVFDQAEFDPADVVAQVVRLHQACSAEKGLELSIDIKPGTPVMRSGDPHRIRQIAHNLLSNAIKFTDKGSIRVVLRNFEDGQLELSVHDTGIGMDDAQSQRIFEDFAQADESITRRFGGTGLGMSIVRRLVQLMDGTIDVTSRLGDGTSVRVVLPLHASGAAQKPEVTPQPEPATAPDLSGLRVLIADDMRTNRVVVEALLRNTGTELTLVENGAEAVSAWAGEPFDVVLLDISMPVMDGPSALREMVGISEKQGRPAPRAIAFTANVMTHQLAEYQSEGFVGHVAKPLRKPDLLAQIAYAAGRVDA